jgi:hypothetical protein
MMEKPEKVTPALRLYITSECWLCDNEECPDIRKAGK